MTLYILEISKYLVAGLSILFATLGFVALNYKSEKKRSPIYVLQTIILALIEILGFLQIVMRTGVISHFFYAVFMTIVLLAMMLLTKAIFPDANRLIINHMAFLMMTSMIILLRIDEKKAIRQLIFSAIAIALMMAACEIVYRFPVLMDLKWVYSLLGVFFLSVVLIVGKATNGSYLSITVAHVTFQPSEFVKILLIFFIASTMYQSNGLTETTLSFAITMIYIAILMISKDLGTSAILFVICLCMVFLSTRKPSYLLTGFMLAVIGSVIGYVMFAHVRLRVHAWLDPWSKIDSSGYQIAQSLFAISSGGLWGLGLYHGNPKTIPYVEDDFIFSAICQELGMIYAIALILVMLGMFLMILLEASRLRDNFSKLLCGGIAVSFIFQTFLTVGGGTKFIPLTGVTLPLVSYGGSSLVSTSLMMGVFEAACLIRADEFYEAMEKFEKRQLKKQRQNQQLRNKQRQEDYYVE